MASGIDLHLEELHFNCAACWTSVCSAHGPVPPATKTRKLLYDHYHLTRIFEEARTNLAAAMDMPADTSMVDLVEQVRVFVSNHSHMGC